jgi:hypothetical protein
LGTPASCPDHPKANPNKPTPTPIANETLQKNWKQALRNEGASPGDIGVYADAFEHAEADKALSLLAS